MLNGIIIFRQFIAAAKFFRKILTLHLPLQKSLLHRTGDCLIAQPFCLSIHRLHGMHDTPVLLRCEHFRLFHGQPPAFFDHTATEYQDLAHLQDIMQIRHVIPGQLQGSRHIPHIRNDDLNIFKTAHGWCFHQLPRYRKHAFFPEISDWNRLFIGIIGTRIVVQKFFYCFYTQFGK